MAVLYWNTSTFVKSTRKSEGEVQNTVHTLWTFPTQKKGNWKHLKTKGTAYCYQKGQQRRHDFCEIPHGTGLRIIKHLFSGGSSKTVWILFLIWILALTSFWTFNFLPCPFFIIGFCLYPAFLRVEDCSSIYTQLRAGLTMFECNNVHKQRFNSSKNDRLRN